MLRAAIESEKIMDNRLQDLVKSVIIYAAKKYHPFGVI